MNPPEAQVPGAQIRVGCDVVSLGEIKHSLSAFGQRFLDKIYTADEQAACAGPDQVARLAARFAAKEAAIKAFSQPDAAFAPRKIEIVTTARLPALRLFGAAAMLAAEQGWNQISVSLTHSDCHAAAVVVAVCSGTTHG